MGKKTHLHIGVLAAMPEEVGTFLSNLSSIKENKYGDLIIFSGIWKGSIEKNIFLSVCFSGWGKVSASRATTRLIASKYNQKEIDFVLFTGVAGSAKESVKQWDIIISNAVFQHDMDARPLFEKYVIPALKTKKIFASKDILEKFEESLYFSKRKGNLENFGDIHKGLIATGDQFISEKKVLKRITSDFNDLLAVEMEGAAFAQVANQENKSWLIIRVISDQADDDAHIDFESFLDKFKKYSWEIIESFLTYIDK